MTSSIQSDSSIRELVKKRFELAGIRPVAIKVRSFPGERIVVVEVASQFEEAVRTGNALDEQIENGFITVRLVTNGVPQAATPVESVHDERVTRLIGLLDERSRTSESQPSLRYIEDVSGRLQIAMAARHHLIFGRRGAGKSALMLEARRQLETTGAHIVWLNIQTVRTLGAGGALLTLFSRLCDLPLRSFGERPAPPKSVTDAAALKKTIDRLLTDRDREYSSIDPLIPDVNKLLQLYCAETQTSVYVFLDDVHYLPYSEGPDFLDRVLAVSRDNPVWLKIAGIRHQMRWFRAEPPTGMQLPHDAIEINLDITLQEPERAKQFLQSVLDAFVDECDAKPRRGFVSPGAIDRLVLASGAVPRDFVTLCAAALQISRKRSDARTTGVQDVNEAAGLAAKVKLQELEEDAAAALGSATSVLGTLQSVRAFCLEQNEYSFFSVDFLDKEKRVEEYGLVQRLLDLRLLHLINGSLSAAHQVGKRSEVYLLDLSEYTGARLRQKLWVLDLENGHLTLKRTRSTETTRVGDNARRLVAILRLGPTLELGSLTPLLTQSAKKKPSIKRRSRKTQRKN